MNHLNTSSIEGGAEVETGAEAVVGTRERVGEGVGVLLPSMEASGGPLTNSSSPPRGGLR